MYTIMQKSSVNTRKKYNQMQNSHNPLTIKGLRGPGPRKSLTINDLRFTCKLGRQSHHPRKELAREICLAGLPNRFARQIHAYREA